MYNYNYYYFLLIGDRGEAGIGEPGPPGTPGGLTDRDRRIILEEVSFPIILSFKQNSNKFEIVTVKFS